MKLHSTQYTLLKLATRYYSACQTRINRNETNIILFIYASRERL